MRVKGGNRRVVADVGEPLKRNGFGLESAHLEFFVSVFALEVTLVLRGEPFSLLMIDSHLSASHAEDLTTPAPVIVVDAGGTNLRVAAVRLTESGAARERMSEGSER